MPYKIRNLGENPQELHDSCISTRAQVVHGGTGLNAPGQVQRLQVEIYFAQL